MSSYVSDSYGFGSTSGPAEHPRARVPQPDEQLTQPELCARFAWTTAQFQRATTMADFPRPKKSTGAHGIIARWSRRQVEQWRDDLKAFAQSL